MLTTSIQIVVGKFKTFGGTAQFRTDVYFNNLSKPLWSGKCKSLIKFMKMIYAGRLINKMIHKNRLCFA